VDLLTLLPNPRRRDAPLAQPALALRRRLSDALKTMVATMIIKAPTMLQSQHFFVAFMDRRPVEVQK
jgi:hypothetical protein